MVHVPLRGRPVSLLRRFLDNPVFLRDLGWRYYPPLFGRIPRKQAQVTVGVLLFGGVFAGALYLNHRAPGAGPLVLWVFAGIGFLALLVRSIITGLRAWQSDRDFKTVDELILTGMSAEEFAAAKVFARGFVFVVGGLMLCLVALGSLLWMALFPSNNMPLEINDWRLVFVLVPLLLLFPALLTNFYLRMLRLGLREGFVLHRAALSITWWLAVLPTVLGLFMAFVVLLAGRVDPDDAVPILIGIMVWLLVPSFWFLSLTCYRDLVAEIRRLYLRAGGEEEPALVPATVGE
jgi:hypothetical protein